ncbi:hypothetical protein [Tardiphaga robiniae]|uniref:hypothetical protein n=1 Tax=Tardiphaga robiniae TaxID=943830 RepID=UPI0011121356|nr:hypothetical protein [Tardiphaga robiniae]
MTSSSDLVRSGPNDAGTGKFLRNCIFGETGRPLPVLASALAMLRNVMPDTFGYDEMARTDLLMQPLDGSHEFSPRPVTDVDVGVVQERFQRLGLKRVSRDVMHQAIENGSPRY